MLNRLRSFYLLVVFLITRRISTREQRPRTHHNRTFVTNAAQAGEPICQTMGGARYGQVQTKYRPVISGSSYLVPFDVVNVGSPDCFTGVRPGVEKSKHFQVVWSMVELKHTGLTNDNKTNIIESDDGSELEGRYCHWAIVFI